VASITRLAADIEVIRRAFAAECFFYRKNALNRKTFSTSARKFRKP
jgi:hypothetical protein